MDIDYSKLDPGVRETVRRLRAWGFKTTDSGDGVSKILAGWDPDTIMDQPHVFMRSNPEQVIDDADRLRELLVRYGILVDPVGRSEVSIEATYDPTSGFAGIMLLGVHDTIWEGRLA